MCKQMCTPPAGDKNIVVDTGSRGVGMVVSAGRLPAG